MIYAEIREWSNDKCDIYFFGGPTDNSIMEGYDSKQKMNWCLNFLAEKEFIPISETFFYKK